MGLPKKKELNYPHPNNYIVTFPWQREPAYLLLVYDESARFRFLDLKTGALKVMSFESVEKAEDWLSKFSTIHNKNVMEVTYVP